MDQYDLGLFKQFAGFSDPKNCIISFSDQNVLAIATAKCLIISAAQYGGESGGGNNAEIQTVLEFNEDFGHVSAVIWIDSSLISVGFDSGHLACFTSGGSMLAESRLHNSSIQKILINDKGVGLTEAGPYMWILFENGHFVTTTVKSFIGGRLDGLGGKLDGQCISFKLSDCAEASDVVFIVNTAVFGDNHEHFAEVVVADNSHYALVAGINQALSLYKLNEEVVEKSQPIAKLAEFITDRMGSIFTRTMGSFFGSTDVVDSPVKTPAPPKVESIPVSSLAGFEDAKRRILRLSISPDGLLVAAADSLGRVALYDIRVSAFVRIWKGCRHARLAWTNDEASSRRDRRRQFLAIYAPQVGLLYFYAVKFGPLVRTVAVGLNVLLFSLSTGKSTKCGCMFRLEPGSSSYEAVGSSAAPVVLENARVVFELVSALPEKEIMPSDEVFSLEEQSKSMQQNRKGIFSLLNAAADLRDSDTMLDFEACLYAFVMMRSLSPGVKHSSSGVVDLERYDSVMHDDARARESVKNMTSRMKSAFLRYLAPEATAEKLLSAAKDIFFGIKNPIVLWNCLEVVEAIELYNFIEPAEMLSTTSAQSAAASDLSVTIRVQTIVRDISRDASLVSDLDESPSFAIPEELHGALLSHVLSILKLSTRSDHHLNLLLAEVEFRINILKYLVLLKRLLHDREYVEIRAEVVDAISMLGSVDRRVKDVAVLQRAPTTAPNQPTPNISFEDDLLTACKGNGLRTEALHWLVRDIKRKQLLSGKSIAKSQRASSITAATSPAVAVTTVRQDEVFSKLNNATTSLFRRGTEGLDSILSSKSRRSTDSFDNLLSPPATPTKSSPSPLVSKSISLANPNRNLFPVTSPQRFSNNAPTDNIKSPIASATSVPFSCWRAFYNRPAATIDNYGDITFRGFDSALEREVFAMYSISRRFPPSKSYNEGHFRVSEMLRCLSAKESSTSSRGTEYFDIEQKCREYALSSAAGNDDIGDEGSRNLSVECFYVTDQEVKGRLRQSARVHKLSRRGTSRLRSDLSYLLLYPLLGDVFSLSEEYSAFLKGSVLGGGSSSFARALPLLFLLFEILHSGEIARALLTPLTSSSLLRWLRDALFELFDVYSNRSSDTGIAGLTSTEGLSCPPTFDILLTEILAPVVIIIRQSHDVEKMFAFCSLLYEVFEVVGESLERRTLGKTNLHSTLAIWTNLLGQLRVTIVLNCRRRVNAGPVLPGDSGAEQSRGMENRLSGRSVSVEELDSAVTSIYGILALDSLSFAPRADDAIEHEKRCLDAYSTNKAIYSSNTQSQGPLVAGDKQSALRWRELLQIADSDLSELFEGGESSMGRNRKPVRRPILLFFPFHNQAVTLGVYRSLVLFTEWSRNLKQTEILTLAVKHLFNVSRPETRAAVGLFVYRTGVLPVLRAFLSLEENPKDVASLALPAKELMAAIAKPENFHEFSRAATDLLRILASSVSVPENYSTPFIGTPTVSQPGFLSPPVNQVQWPPLGDPFSNALVRDFFRCGCKPEAVSGHLALLFCVQLRWQCALRGVRPSELFKKPSLATLCSDTFLSDECPSGWLEAEGDHDLRKLRQDFLWQCFRRIEAATYSDPESSGAATAVAEAVGKMAGCDARVIYNLATMWGLTHAGNHSTTLAHLKALLECESAMADERAEELISRVPAVDSVVDLVVECLRLRFGNALARIDRIRTFAKVIATIDNKAVQWARLAPNVVSPENATVELIASGKKDPIRFDLSSTRYLIVRIIAIQSSVSQSNGESDQSSEWENRKVHCDALAALCSGLGRIGTMANQRTPS